MAYSDIQEKLSQQRMANSVLLAEKYSQGNLFPKGSEGNPYSKNPRAEGARKKREYKKAQEEKKKAREVSENARKREWERRKDRGEVFGDMPPDFNLMETGGKLLDLLKFIPQMMIRGNQIATHDRPLFRTPPASGAAGDNLAPDWLIDYMNRKDENLFQVIDRLKKAKLPHTPPTEKIVLPNGKLMDSPLRFKTDQERIKFMEDFSRGYGRYS